MDWQAILLTVISLVLTTVLTFAGEKLVAWLNTKIKNGKALGFLTSATNIVIGAVKATYQTYVEALKGKNMFDGTAQKNALEMAKNAAIGQLSADAKAYIEQTYGDVEKWIEGTIESVIYDLKNKNAE